MGRNLAVRSSTQFKDEAERPGKIYSSVNYEPKLSHRASSRVHWVWLCNGGWHGIFTHTHSPNLRFLTSQDVPLLPPEVDTVIPLVPVLRILHGVGKRPVSSFGQCQGQDSAQQRAGAEDDQRYSRTVVVQHVYDWRQNAAHPREHAGNTYSRLPLREQNWRRHVKSFTSVWVFHRFIFSQ